MLNFALGKIGGTKLGTDWYWSSSERSDGDAWVLLFHGGGVGSNVKDYDGYVRPVMQY